MEMQNLAITDVLILMSELDYPKFMYRRADGEGEQGEAQIYYAECYSPEKLPKHRRLDQLQLTNIVAVPPAAFYPTLRGTWTLAPEGVEQDDTIFIKRPRLCGYDIDDTPEITPAAELADEIEILEILRDKPHPGLVDYKGVCVKNGRVIGIALKKYENTLKALAYYEGFQIPQAKQDFILSGVKNALEYLHALGFVHEDIHPENIMIKDDGNPVLIDFDSCYKIGAKAIGKGGHSYWERATDRCAHPDDDWYSFDILKQYLASPKTVPD